MFIKSNGELLNLNHMVHIYPIRGEDDETLPRIIFVDINQKRYSKILNNNEDLEKTFDLLCMNLTHRSL